MRVALFGLLLLTTLSGPVLAQDGSGTAPSDDPVVLADGLTGWIGADYDIGMRCRQTILAMIKDHKLITDPKAVGNAQALADRLGAALDYARADMYAKGLSFEDGLAIDAYFYALAAQRTARFAQSRQAGDLAVDLRRCPATALALETGSGGG